MCLTEKLIRLASPTLAGYKTASLFNLDSDLCSEADLVSLRESLIDYGLDIKKIRTFANRTLIYVYNVKSLTETLDRPCVRRFLADYGYDDFSIKSSLNLLISHFKRQESFPHEVGIFLGYPLADVSAFIRNHGKNEKYCGYWKVYYNVESSKRIFRKFDACIDCLKRRYLEGESLDRLIAIS